MSDARDIREFFRAEDFNAQHGDHADHKSSLISPELAAERASALLREWVAAQPRIPKIVAPDGTVVADAILVDIRPLEGE